MRRSEAVRDMEANLIPGPLRDTSQALQRLIRRIPLLSYRSLIRTSLGPPISIICHISFQYASFLAYTEYRKVSERQKTVRVGDALNS
jgi:hypothetical protein